MSFKSVLKSINDDLNKLKNINPSTLFESLIQEALNNTYENYCHNIKVNYDYLLRRDNLKVLKTIKREENKKKESK